MKIYVCVKDVPDSAANIRLSGPSSYDESVIHLMNPYDENALEAACTFRDSVGGDVIALSFGKDRALNTVRAALSLGADRGILVLSGQSQMPDSIFTSRVLAEVIEREGPPGMVFTGRSAIDSEGMQTMFRLAAHLGLPVLSDVVGLDLSRETVHAVREMDEGSRVSTVIPVPCVIGASKALNKPHYPTLPEILRARSKPVRTVHVSELKIPPLSSRVEIVSLSAAVEERKGHILSGPLDQACDELIRILREEEKLI
jgi:electron transfer flavoprotein beta subunit